MNIDEEFDDILLNVFQGMMKLRRMALEVPSRARVEKMVGIAVTSSECLASPLPENAPFADPDRKEDRAGFNNYLREVAEDRIYWPVTVSVVRGKSEDGIDPPKTFARSPKDDTPLELFLADIHLGWNHLAEKTREHRGAGTDIRSMTGFITEEIQKIRRHARIEIESGGAAALGEESVFCWIQRAAKLESLSPSSIDAWTDVMLLKWEAERDRTIRKYVGVSFQTYSKNNGGGSIKSYIRREVRKIVERLVATSR